MTRHLHNVGWLVVLSGALASAQNMPQHRQPQQYPPPPSQTQQQLPTPDQSRTSTVNKGDVQNEIQAALQKEPTLTGANINVQVTEKNVELSGTVPSRDAKDAAEQIAKAHSGGLGVKNHLKISQSPR
ncbi:MAG TPA: BON domain-containing protein [Candidatus Angelobacter sp.]|nr:BON domain-containing protein [Candidatus Angelobacter sp.]